MIITKGIPRRTFLRGLGTMLALPVLDGAAPSLARGQAAGGASPFPKRMAYIYVPNGKNMADWTPAKTGRDYDMSMILKPLEKNRADFSVVSGLAHQNGNALGDGGGDHARASAVFLTGAHPRKTAGADIKVGVSVDQVAASVIGDNTKFPSLELSCDRGQRAGACDSGYSCAYQFNISWKSPTMPINPEVSPRAAFDRIFGSLDPNETAEMAERRKLYRKSLLDFVLGDANSLMTSLAASDKRKVDEYLTAVREIEKRVELSEKYNVELPDGAAAPAETDDYTYQQHLRLMYDILALSFQADATRIGTFIAAHDGSNRPYPFIGINDGHHDLSHHRNDAAKKAKIAQINKFHTEQFGYFLDKLKAIPEGEGTLLDNCAILYGSALSEGNSHSHYNLPFLLAGRGGGQLSPGQHISVQGDVPATNLFLSMLQTVGAPQERFADSTGLLKEVFA